MDDIPKSFLRNLPDTHIEYIQRLFNGILNANTDIPEEWKHQLIIPVLKPNKGPNNHTNYRPIILSLQKHPNKGSKRLPFLISKHDIKIYLLSCEDATKHWRPGNWGEKENVKRKEQRKCPCSGAIFVMASGTLKKEKKTGSSGKLERRFNAGNLACSDLKGLSEISGASYQDQDLRADGPTARVAFISISIVTEMAWVNGAQMGLPFGPPVKYDTDKREILHLGWRFRELSGLPGGNYISDDENQTEGSEVTAASECRRDWNRIAIFIMESHMSTLIDVIDELSNKKIMEMRKSVMFVYEKYFSSMEKIALTTLDIVQDRVYRHKGRTYDKLNLLPSEVIIIVSQFPKISKAMNIIKTKANKLSNIFHPYREIETEAILHIDDDIVMLTSDEIEFAFEVWREFPDRIVGFPSRTHLWDNVTNSWKYESEWLNEISMVLTGAAFLHKYWSYLYTVTLPSNIKTG
ncbi:hypothetical protein HUJ04_011107 [Dendroctonus ponderosae]|nr:hypothetical protein HUJ04_011107 [Dendroctonus ponderosae]